MKIVIGIPSPDQLHPDFSLSNLPQIIAYSKSHISDLELSIMHKTGVMTSSNRNYILNEAIQERMDGILWLDADQIYPIDILYQFLRSKKQVIGAVYFKRAEPYDVVAYVKGTNPTKPYLPVDIARYNNEVIEVDGLGFGGMYVSMDVYKALGDSKWMKYGTNFGIPKEMTNQESHDLVFCQSVKEAGIPIYLHTGVKCGHIADKLVTMDDYMIERTITHTPICKVLVVLPSIDVERAKQTVEQLKKSAGYPAEYLIAEDVDRSGFIATFNEATIQNEADYYVYTAEDAVGGENWLLHAMHTMYGRSGLLAFNDGKWNGRLASFGLVSKDYSMYDGYYFHPEYHSHYADTELTQMAKKQGKLFYNPRAKLIEVDPLIVKKSVNKADKELYNRRKCYLFGKELAEEFI
jgi:hypothetical protein